MKFPPSLTSFFKKAFLEDSWLSLVILFVTVFYPCDILTRFRKPTTNLAFLWESYTPYMPGMYVFYYSALAIPLLLTTKVSNHARVRFAIRQCKYAICIAGVIFIVFPTTMPIKSSNYTTLEEVTEILAAKHNCFPSLHVLLTLILSFPIWEVSGIRGRFGLCICVVVLMASTLLTHQHQFADILCSWVIFGALIVFGKQRQESMHMNESESKTGSGGGLGPNQ